MKQKLILQELQLFVETHPEYTFGEALYSFIKLLKVKKNSDFLSLSDDDILNSIRKAQLIETELQ